jgi:hypothetical protein
VKHPSRAFQPIAKAHVVRTDTSASQALYQYDPDPNVLTLALEKIIVDSSEEVCTISLVNT